ncbi:hypothetical protein [Streptomyces thermoalcalitolerans]|uniref:Uncharacterized protein n=1 Tax=Streptomyces thermoalcalitolerans TaxID=65605 RepID=A0ABN1NHZ1_9ACTN
MGVLRGPLPEIPVHPEAKAPGGADEGVRRIDPAPSPTAAEEPSTGSSIAA